MLDTLHFMYEEDVTPKWELHQEYKSQLRENIYSLLYDTEYEYSTDKYSNEDTEYSSSNPYSPPREGEVKPYIPPTSPEDLQFILGNPMGE